MSSIQCKICESTKYSVIRNRLRHDIKRNVLRCGSCDFVYLEPRSKNSKKYYSGVEYRKMYGPTLKKASTPREIFDMYLPFQERIIDQFRKVLRKDMKVLDVGCSTGHLLAALKGKVKTRIAVELNKEEAGFVRKTQKIKVYSDPIETVVIPEGPFDLVVSARVLEHVDDPLTFMKSIARHVKPGGYVYIDIPNLDDALLSVFNVEGYENFYFREPHVSYFSPKSFSLLLKKAGFHGTVKSIQRYNFPNAMHWIQTGKPQGNFAVGNRIPAIAPKGVSHRKAREELNAFSKNVDSEYKKILAAHGLGEALIFFGKVRKPTRRT